MPWCRPVLPSTRAGSRMRSNMPSSSNAWRRAWPGSGWPAMHLNDLMGMEVRGMPLTTCSARRAQEVSRLLTEVPAPARSVWQMVLRAERSLGRPALEARDAAAAADRRSRRTSAAGPWLICKRGLIGRQPRRFTLTGSARILTPARPRSPATQESCSQRALLRRPGLSPGSRSKRAGRPAPGPST